MKLISLNVNNFGGAMVKKISRDWRSPDRIKERERRADLIAAWILEQEANLVVLQEFEIGHVGDRLIERLTAAYYELHYEKLRQGSSVVVVAVKRDIGGMAAVISKIDRSEHISAFARWIEVDLEGPSGEKLKVIGLHIPFGETRREQFRQALLRTDIQTPTVLIGDFNAAGRNDRAAPEKTNKETLTENESLLKELFDIGYKDAWRDKHPWPTQEYTWFNNRNLLDGRRLDYAFLSRHLECVSAKHILDVNVSINEEQSSLTDHSALFVELTLRIEGISV